MIEQVSDNQSGVSDIIDENVRAIGQLVGLLDTMPGSLYRRCFGRRDQHVIGKHVRHIVDHYSALLTATRSTEDLLDYENRNRELALETDRRAGRNRLVELMQELFASYGNDHPDELVMSHNSGGERQEVTTSVGRELVFLASHTIHHMAIIGMLAEQAGVEVDADFGVHPSTLRHLERQMSVMAKSA